MRQGLFVVVILTQAHKQEPTLFLRSEKAVCPLHVHAVCSLR